MSRDLRIVSASKSTREDLIRENERLRFQLETLKSSRLASNVATILKSFFRAATIVGVALCAAYAVHEVAGKITDFRAVIDANLHQNAEERGYPIVVTVAKWAIALCTVMSLSAIWIARRSLKLKRDATTSLSDYRRRYEELIDPHRTSSGLSKDGSTREDDRL